MKMIICISAILLLVSCASVQKQPEIGNPTSPPFGWEDFCKRNPSECTAP
jgi:predicted transglutaminase-like cysteine proteinase